MFLLLQLATLGWVRRRQHMLRETGQTRLLPQRGLIWSAARDKSHETGKTRTSLGCTGDGNGWMGMTWWCEWVRGSQSDRVRTPNVHQILCDRNNARGKNHTPQKKHISESKTRLFFISRQHGRIQSQGFTPCATQVSRFHLTNTP